MNRLGGLIRSKRERAGLRAYDVAARIGKQPSYITRLETGATKTLPPPEELAGIGDALGLSMAEMIEAAGYPVSAPSAWDDSEDVEEIAEHARLVDWQRDASRLPVVHAILRTWSEFDRNSLRSVAEESPEYE